MTLFLMTVLAFITTNLDDLFLLTALFTLLERNKYYKIVIGQYLGLLTLLGLSIFSILSFSHSVYIPLHLLGFIPLIIGGYSLVLQLKSQKVAYTPPVLPTTIIGISLLTISNGGDNFSIYLSIFSGYPMSQLISVLGLFIIFIGIWCLIGYYLSTVPYITSIIQKHSSLLIPIILCCIGLSIIF